MLHIGIVLETICRTLSNGEALKVKLDSGKQVIFTKELYYDAKKLKFGDKIEVLTQEHKGYVYARSGYKLLNGPMAKPETTREESAYRKWRNAKFPKDLEEQIKGRYVWASWPHYGRHACGWVLRAIAVSLPGYEESPGVFRLERIVDAE